MKRLVLLMLVICATVSYAAEQVSSIMNEDGNEVDRAKARQFIEWVEPSIRQYPPRFESEDQQKRITISSMLVTGEIRRLDLKGTKEVDLLTDLAQIMAMGHQIDLPTAGDAKAIFEQALSVDPESKRANYLFGMFLFSTSKHFDDALKYLQKAYELGEKDAQYSIGLFLCRKGETEKGLKHLEEYSAANSKNEHVKKVIKGIRDGSLKFGDSESDKTESGDL